MSRLPAGGAAHAARGGPNPASVRLPAPHHPRTVRDRLNASVRPWQPTEMRTRLHALQGYSNQQNQAPNQGTYAHRAIGSQPGGGQSQCGGPHSPCASTTAEPGTDTANAATIKSATTTRSNIPSPSFDPTRAPISLPLCREPPALSLSFPVQQAPRRREPGGAAHYRARACASGQPLQPRSLPLRASA